MSIKNKLNRLKPHLAHEHTDKTLVSSKPLIDGDKIPFLDIWEQNDVKPYYFDGDYCLVREREFSIHQYHGKYRFQEFVHAVEAWNNSTINHPLSAKGHDAEQFFFFDTETTGLGGGAGNTIFILGHASIHGDKIRLKQHILPHPGSEVSLYKSFLDSVNYRTMATYNGKSFDWPQVKTRHTLIREHVPKLPPFGHFDLYHASRRMWKHKLERLKLSIVEKEILEVERKDDLPGFLAPMIYFDFLETKNPEGMLSVLKHNELDILSLICLYTHLSFQILGIDKTQTVQEVLEIGRWFSYLGETTLAKAAYGAISNGDDENAVQAKHALAYEYKKLKKWAEAKELWQAITENGHKNNKINLEACIELAKLYEHQEKNIEKAIFYASMADATFRNDPIKTSVKYDEIINRLQRLTRKRNNSLKNH